MSLEAENNQPQSKRARQHTGKQHKGNRSGDGTGRGSAPGTDATPVQAHQVNHLVKDIRRAAHALRCPSSDATYASGRFFHDTLWPSVKAFLDDHVSARADTADAPLLRVRLVALGIGPFSRRESRVSFLQMATFVALHACISQYIKTPAATPTTGPSGEGETVEDAGAARVQASSFEPVFVDALHGECTRRLGIAVETENRLGAYAAGDPAELLILFMPHCPWVLVHNALLTNWPREAPVPAAAPTTQDVAGQPGGSQGGGEAPSAVPEVLFHPLRNLLLIGNSVRCTPLGMSTDGAKGRRPWTLTADALLNIVEVAPLLAEEGGKRGKGRGPARAAPSPSKSDMDVPGEHEEGSAGLPGLSRSDIEEAFHSTAIMRVPFAALAPGAKGLSDMIAAGKRNGYRIIRKAPEMIDTTPKASGAQH